MSSPDQAAGKPNELIWVRNVDGRPHIRWRRCAAYVLAAAAMSFGSVFGIHWFAGTPLRSPFILMSICGWLGYLVLAVELQRQRVQTGKWRFRLSLAAVLVMIGIACTFFALMGAELRQNLRWAAENKEMVAQLEEVIDGGLVSLGALDGGDITCRVTRPDFNDADLAQVINLASRRGAGDCELRYLFLGGTSVSEAGVRKLVVCRKLTMLEIPSMPLSDEAIDAIAQCRRLEFLLLDERKLTARQLARVRAELPNLKLNGQPWNARIR